ncbi:hypothetical protein BKA58DRAFT_469629 [Alternaria rosae]|uniref:uncharacterized protein n=1 Tax=Alternaria rosae TaxID=1187941 RepID=UPI001E8CB602|nr:uncharacterized protein BKA58DRAFT_469629 [Alternaria rosae]KAH6870636.1 hypothetical protein BKA58DRAFT_469629 [Alternaria rosae]
MAANGQGIASPMRDLQIVQRPPPEQDQESRRSKRTYVTAIQDATHALTEASGTISLQEQNIRPLSDQTSPSETLSIEAIYWLHSSGKELSNAAKSLASSIDALNHAAERLKRTLITKLFSHFGRKIRNTIHELLDTTSDRNLLWKVAEECYDEAASDFGALRASDYFESPEEGKREPQSQDRMQKEQTWIDYWLTILNNAPNGPTLFYPPTSFNNHSLKFEDVPQYLFRAFDAFILGTDGVMRSIESSIGPKGKSRTDLLSLNTDQATTLLHAHLKKTCFSREKDNLVSWTSSLLFAIQYALYRQQCGQGDASGYKICAVETRKFPQGQFARDIWLIPRYRSDGVGQYEAQDFFNFRLHYEDYYNGEYLSQGAVSIADRSCVTSLKLLEEAGLFELYPEFEDAGGRTRWAKRVLALRQDWSEKRGTSKQEIKLALQMARTCFPQLASVDVATALLTFRNRKLRTSTLSEWADKPVEVRRYWDVTEVAKARDRALDVQTEASPQQDPEAALLRRIFSLQERPVDSRVSFQ